MTTIWGGRTSGFNHLHQSEHEARAPRRQEEGSLREPLSSLLRRWRIVTGLQAPARARMPVRWLRRNPFRWPPRHDGRASSGATWPCVRPKI